MAIGSGLVAQLLEHETINGDEVRRLIDDSAQPPRLDQRPTSIRIGQRLQSPPPVVGEEPPLTVVPAFSSGRTDLPSKLGDCAGGLVVTLAALGWGLVVLFSYFPRPVALARSLIGLTQPPALPALSAISRPEQIGWTLIGQHAWAVIGAGLLAWMATALGAVLAERLDLTESESAAGLLWVVPFGLGAIGFAVFGLALAGLLTPAALAVLGAGLLYNAVNWTVRRLQKRRGTSIGNPSPSAHGESIGPGLPYAASRRVVLRALMAVLFGCFLGTALASALLPEVEYDAIWYHLFEPQQYLQAGRIVDLPNVFPSLYPQTVEMLFALGLAWQGPIAAKLVHFLFGLLTLGATYLLARRWLNRRYSLFAALSVLTAPTIQWEMSTAHVDLAATCFVTVALFDLVSWWDEPDRKKLDRAGIMTGLALACKHTVLFFLPGMLLLILAGGLRRETILSMTAGGWRRLVPPGKWWNLDPRPHPWFMHPLIFLGIALVFLLPWYVRSWLVTGNPVFPTFWSVFGAPPDRWNRLSEEGTRQFNDHFGAGRDLSTLLTLPWHMTVAPPQFGGSLGPVFLMALPLVAIVLLTPGGRRGSLRILAVWAVIGTALWASPFSSFQLRFLLPITPALATLSAAGLAWLASALRSSGRNHLADAILPAMLAVLLLDLQPLIPWHGPGWGPSTPHEPEIAGVVDPGAASAYLARHVRGYSAIAFVNERVAPPAVILTFVEGLDYYSRYPLLDDNLPPAQPATYASRVGRETTVLETLRRRAITHVILPRDLRELRSFDLAIVDETFIHQHLTLVYADEEAAVYAVHL